MADRDGKPLVAWMVAEVLAESALTAVTSPHLADFPWTHGHVSTLMIQTGSTLFGKWGNGGGAVNDPFHLLDEIRKCRMVREARGGVVPSTLTSDIGEVGERMKDAIANIEKIAEETADRLLALGSSPVDEKTTDTDKEDKSGPNDGSDIFND